MDVRSLALLIALCGFTIPVPAIPQTTPQSAEHYAETGNRALQEGRYAEAEQAFERLKELEPNTAEVSANLGLIYFEEKKFDRAVPELRRALKLKPSLTNSGFILAMSLAELGQLSDAVSGLEKGFRTGNPQMKRLCGLQLERAYTGLNRDSDAVKVALEMEQLYPKDPEVQYHDGKIFGNFAYMTMQKLWQAAPDSIWKHQAEAEALESQGSFEAAIGQYREVLARDPRRPGIHYRLGRILLARSQKIGAPEGTDAATKEFEQEIQLDPTNANAAYELAEIDRNAGRFDDAQKYFELALQGHPDFEEAHLGFAAALISAHKPELALPHLQKAISLNHDNEVAWWRMSQVERLLGDAEGQKKALAEFERLHTQAAASPQPTGSELFSPNEVTHQQVDTSQQ
jgi:tetratricopeptide (TPR) repeat protein